MRRRRTILWVSLFLVLLPTVMAGADAVQRSREGQVLFRTPEFREGDVFVYALDYASAVHGYDTTVSEYMVIEVGAVTTMARQDGVAVDVLPITSTTQLVPWDAYSGAYAAGPPVAIEGAVTWTNYFGIDDGASYAQVENLQRSRWFVDDEGQSERRDDTRERTLYGTYSGLLSTSWHPGLSVSHASAPIAGILDVMGFDNRRAHEDGYLDGRHIYNVGYEDDSLAVASTNSFYCFHSFPQFQYVDFQGTESVRGEILHAAGNNDVWMAAGLAFPALSTCDLTYRIGSAEGAVVEMLHHGLRLTDYVPGERSVPIPWGRGHQYEPTGIVPAQPTHPTGAPQDGAASPLRTPLSDAIAFVGASEDSTIAAFRSSADPPFVVVQASYSAPPAPNQGPTSIGGATGALPPLPVDEANPASPARRTTWWLSLDNGLGEQLRVSVSQTLQDDGSVVETVVEPRGEVEESRWAGRAEHLPPTVVTISDILNAWARDTGRNPLAWRDDPSSAFTFGYAVFTQDDAVTDMVGYYRITSALVPGQAVEEGTSANRHDHYNAADGARTQESTFTSQTRNEAARPQTTASRAPATVATGHVPTAAAASGVAVVVMFAVAAFWDGLRSALIKLVFLPLYAKISKDKLLDHGTRDEIVAFVEANPGANQSEVRSALGMGFGTTIHHMAVLERNQLVLSAKVGRQRCYFTPGQIDFKQRRATGLLRGPAAQRMVSAVSKHPGITQSELSDVLGVTPRAVRAQAERLEEVGAITTVRRGGTVRYSLAENAAS